MHAMAAKRRQSPFFCCYGMMSAHSYPRTSFALCEFQKNPSLRGNMIGQECPDSDFLSYRNSWGESCNAHGSSGNFEDRIEGWTKKMRMASFRTNGIRTWGFDILSIAPWLSTYWEYSVTWRWETKASTGRVAHLHKPEHLPQSLDIAMSIELPMSGCSAGRRGATCCLRRK
jgi:hypothetical protein